MVKHHSFRQNMIMFPFICHKFLGLDDMVKVFHAELCMFHHRGLGHIIQWMVVHGEPLIIGEISQRPDAFVGWLQRAPGPQWPWHWAQIGQDVVQSLLCGIQGGLRYGDIVGLHSQRPGELPFSTHLEIVWMKYHKLRMAFACICHLWLMTKHGWMIAKHWCSIDF